MREGEKRRKGARRTRAKGGHRRPHPTRSHPRAHHAGASYVRTDSPPWNRVQLAKLLRRGGNLFLLDEPTNDLDVDTLRVLDEALLAFNGCAVAISHDRRFLDRIATHIIAFEGEGTVRWFEGNHQAYAEKRRQEMGKDADQPRRIRYKKLTT